MMRYLLLFLLVPGGQHFFLALGRQTGPEFFTAVSRQRPYE